MRRPLCVALAPLAVAVSLGACIDEPTGIGSLSRLDVCSRTPQVQDEIVRRAGVPLCTVVTAEDLAAITWLNLDGAGITSVQEGDFDGLTGMVRLDLGGNSLTSLPEGVFSGLSSLRELFLHFNALNTLPEGVFHGLANLEWLTLHENELTALQPGVFNGLSHLKRLSLISNKISSPPETVFQGLSNLEDLHLGSSGITSVPEGLFGGLARLEWLHLVGNNLRSLPPGVFSQLGSLERLDLSYNLLDTLPEHLFVDLVALKTLQLDRNNLRSLREGLLSRLQRLESLTLSHNPLESLPGNVFAPLDDLRSLDLSFNRLSDLPEQVFARLTALQRLDLGFNRLTELPAEVFGGLTPLRVLKLEGNRLDKLSSDLFADLSKLEILSLADNDLEELPSEIFAGLESLKRLTLHGSPGAPFALTLRVERTDGANLLSPGPARVAVSLDQGAPFDMTVNVSAQGGELSVEQVTLGAGSTTSREFEVTSSAGAATHVSVGPPPLVSGEFTGIEIAVADPIVLFAEAANHSPLAAKAIPPYRLRAGGRAGEVDLSFPYFEDPDGDSLIYEVVSGNPEVAEAGMSGGVATFAGIAEGTALVTIRATDPKGLSAEQSVQMNVIAPGDPEGFDIDLVVVGDVPGHVLFKLRQAVERWRRIVAQTDLPTTAVLPDDDLECFGVRPGFRVADIEDLLVLATVTTDVDPGFWAQAGLCRTRDSSHLPLVAVVRFNEAYLDRMVADGILSQVAVHQIGHALGIGTIWGGLGLLRNPSRHGNRGADAHFVGPLATAAFDAAGGAAYTGGAKVPVENRFSDGFNDSHWRTSVMQNEIMTPLACVQPAFSPLSAISIQALADFGYTVDVSLADPYTVPLPSAAIAEPAADLIGLGNDMLRGPIRVINEQGEVVRVLRN